MQDRVLKVNFDKYKSIGFLWRDLNADSSHITYFDNFEVE